MLRNVFELAANNQLQTDKGRSAVSVLLAIDQDDVVGAVELKYREMEICFSSALNT